MIIEYSVQINNHRVAVVYGSMGDALITLHLPLESVTNLKITFLDKFVTS